MWDYLAFAPAAGYLLGRMNQACFVGETEMAKGWGDNQCAAELVFV